MVGGARKWTAALLFAGATGFPVLLAGGALFISLLARQGCSGGPSTTDTPSGVAEHDIPPRLLAIYQRVGAAYRLPWEILAGIGKEECDQGLDPDPSCTPQPGATSRGAANFAGASGPMQIGVGGAAGDEYDPLRRFLPDPALGPHDPTTAVELAALVLVKDKEAPVGKPIDAYGDYVRAYNGSGPLAEAYAARVLADAHAYEGAGMTLVAAGTGTSVGGCIGAPGELTAASGAYVNPFAGEAWGLSRNDQGVDYDPLRVEPIRAIGAGTIVGIGSWGSYGPWFDYKLAAGPLAGRCIYVAEHIGSILAPGTQFNAGDTLAIAYPGPDWTEWGWAKALDTPAVTWSECGCTEEDNVNPGGRAFARFLRSLGARTEQDPGPGPMYAGGSC